MEFKLATIVILNLFYFIQAFKLPSKGYHSAVGMRKAFDLMNSELGMSRIIGGSQTASISLYPYQAGIDIKLTNGWTSVCGGALVSNTRVLTAAHCWWDGQNQAAQFTVVLGSLLLYSGGTRITTKDVAMHSNWKQNELNNDIAIIKITSVNYSNNIQAISLPSSSDANQNFAALTATATGYGKTSDAQSSFPATTSLRHVDLKVMTNVECQKSFEITIHGSQLCTDGNKRVGTCDGDSGGPLTATWNNKRTLIGLVSFGSESCEASTPSVYTRVSAFLTWISANL